MSYLGSSNVRPADLQKKLKAGSACSEKTVYYEIESLELPPHLNGADQRQIINFIEELLSGEEIHCSSGTNYEIALNAVEQIRRVM